MFRRWRAGLLATLGKRRYRWRVVGFDEGLDDLVRKTEKSDPKPEDVRALRRYLEKHPDTWRVLGDLAEFAYKRLVDVSAGDQVAVGESLKAGRQALRAGPWLRRSLRAGAPVDRSGCSLLAPATLRGIPPYRRVEWGGAARTEDPLGKKTVGHADALLACLRDAGTGAQTQSPQPANQRGRQAAQCGRLTCTMAHRHHSRVKKTSP